MEKKGPNRVRMVFEKYRTYVFRASMFDRRVTTMATTITATTEKKKSLSDSYVTFGAAFIYSQRLCGVCISIFVVVELFVVKKSEQWNKQNK